MRIDEAEKAIVHEWRSWCLREGKQESGADEFEGLLFYSYLSQQRPDLLKFRCRGEKWHQVQAWLRGTGCLRD